MVNPVVNAANLFATIFEVLPSEITSIVFVPMVCIFIIGVARLMH